MGDPWALVTGASRGIGRAIAGRLCADGYRVVAVARDGELLDGLVGACGPERVTPYVVDLGDLDAVRALVASVSRAHPQLQVIVNNAATVDHLSLEAATEEIWQRTVQVNLMAPIALIRGLAPQLSAPASVVNIGSVLGTLPSRSASPYVVTKGALHHATRVLALELADRGIRVNAVAPGFIATEMFARGRTDESQRRIAEAHPMGRPGRVEEVAAAVSYLCSPEASFITGAVLPVDGGLACQMSVTDLEDHG